MPRLLREDVMKETGNEQQQRQRKYLAKVLAGITNTHAAYL